MITTLVSYARQFATFVAHWVSCLDLI